LTGSILKMTNIRKYANKQRAKIVTNGNYWREHNDRNGYNRNGRNRNKRQMFR